MTGDRARRGRTSTGVLVELAGASNDMSWDDENPAQHLGVEKGCLHRAHNGLAYCCAAETVTDGRRTIAQTSSSDKPR